MRIALKFAYDGRKFHGFARQPDLKTVEGEIIQLLIENGYILSPTKSVFRCASRTDKGVSALGNVIAFNTDKNVENIFEEINIDEDIVFYGIKKVDEDFYPRYAKQRIYRYYLKDKDCDIKEIKDTSSLFVGTHDFTNFARIEQGKNPVRTIDDIKVFEENEYVVLELFAQTFLWNQIRRIISAIEKVCNGKISNDEIINALKNPENNYDFGLADPKFLVLYNVVYDFVFEEKLDFKKFKGKIIGNF